jgi:predicted transcriptional regulator
MPLRTGLALGPELIAADVLVVNFPGQCDGPALICEVKSLTMDEKNAAMIGLTADLVAAFVGNNSVAVADLPNLIKTVHAALSGAEAPAPEAVEDTVKPTAGQIRKSITHDALISFLDGKPYKTLKRHLTTHGVTVAEYKTRFGLPNDYPTTAPAYSEARSAMAKALGLGQGGRKAKAPVKAPAKTTKARAKSA